MASGDQHQGSNLYDVLGISPGATKDEIVKAYRQQALKYHPDKSLDDRTEEWMKCLNQAKEVLLSEQRSEYDEKLADEGQTFVHREPLGYLPEGIIWILIVFIHCDIIAMITRTTLSDS